MVQAEVTIMDKKNISDLEHRDVEGLTEVLRLQAEALSRISERMAGMNKPAPGIPPQATLKDQPGDGLHLPALSGDPSLKEDSLPVLNSFKQFLEQERRQGRKRFVWGLVGLTVAFSIVLGGIVWLNSKRVHTLKADIQQTSARLDLSKQEAEVELKKVSDKVTDKVAQSAARNVATMRSDINRNILWAHSALASNMTSELSGRDGEIERLKEKVSTLEVDNTLLVRQVTELAQRVKTIETDYLDYLERSVNDARSSSGVKEGVAVTSNAVPGMQATPLIINSAKFGRTMQMQVPKE